MRQPEDPPRKAIKADTLPAGFSRGFEVSAAIMMLALMVATAMTRVTRQDMTEVQPVPGGHPGRTGGPWLWRTFVLSLFQAVVVPSGFRTRVQPQRWMTTW